MLKAEGLVINRKRTERLYREEGLSLRRKRRRKLPAMARAPIPMPQEPNERWSMDFIHDQLATGRRFRCLTLVDDFTRQCLALHVDTSIGGATVVAILQRLALTRKLPRTITVDNGPEFTGKALHLWAQHSGVVVTPEAWAKTTNASSALLAAIYIIAAGYDFNASTVVKRCLTYRLRMIFLHRRTSRFRPRPAPI